MPQVTNSVTKMSFFGHEGISSKIFEVLVYMISKNLSHFHPYSILTGEGWIRGLNYVKGISENVLVYISFYILLTEPDFI